MDETVARVSGLIRDPLFVDRLVDARQHAQDLRPARIDPDVAADRIHDIDGFGFYQLPRASDECIRLRGQRPDRTQIDDVGRQFGIERALDIGRDLHVLAASGGAQLLDPGNFGQKADATRAMDAAGHVGFDQRAEILVADGALVLFEPAAVEAVRHRLILQIAFAALIADRAIERMINEEELHYPLLCLNCLWGFSENHHPVSCGHRTRGYRLRRFLYLDETHPAVSCNREALVETEMRNLDPCVLAGLKDRGTSRYLDLFPVDGQLWHLQAACLSRTADWRYSAMRRSISGRKWRISPCTGHMAPSASAQIV